MIDALGASEDEGSEPQLGTDQQAGTDDQPRQQPHERTSTTPISQTQGDTTTTPPRTQGDTTTAGAGPALGARDATATDATTKINLEDSRARTPIFTSDLRQGAPQRVVHLQAPQRVVHLQADNSTAAAGSERRLTRQEWEAT